MKREPPESVVEGFILANREGSKRFWVSLLGVGVAVVLYFAGYRDPDAMRERVEESWLARWLS